MKWHAPHTRRGTLDSPDAEVAVLVVEDNVDDIMILRRHFSRLSGTYTVEIAHTAADAIAKLSDQRFDIAFVDHHLPDARGEFLIADIISAAPGLPIVMLTGRGDERLAVEVMKAGAYDYLRKDDLSRSILSRTVRSVLNQAQLKARIDAATAELAQLAIRDGLTGLFNRRHFGQLVETEFARARRYAQPLACLMLDIDHFKRFNDTRGHQCGDAVLRHVAELIVGVARQVDVVARYGGEEFVLLLPNTDLEGALRVAERIRQTIASRPLVFEDEPVAVTVSLGVATNDAPGVESTEALIKRADDGLYMAKRTGRNRVCRADRVEGPASPEAIVRRRSATAALATLIDAFETRTPGEAGHSRHSCLAVARFARRLGCDVETYEALVIAARLKSIGRLATPGQVGPLDDAQHRDAAETGWRILGEIGLAAPALDAVRHQDARWDGEGGALSGEAIPETARILRVADTWCRLRRTADHASAIAGMRACGGTTLDPALVEVFCDLQIEQTDSS